MIAALITALVLALPQQTPQPQSQPASNDIDVYLVTVDVGSLVYELFGHNAIWVRSPSMEPGKAYNWGIFAFDEPGFLVKFLRGYMRYQMMGFPMDQMAGSYQRDNRSVYLQRLNLTPAQKTALLEFLLWNEQPQNRYYDYDYYRDNCSTRARDALDRVLGGQLKRTLEPIESGSTFRSETKRAMIQNLPLYTGTMLALGPFVDRSLNAWEESFIPMELREWVREVKVTAPDGTQQPLVLEESTVFQAEREPIPDVAPNAVPWFVVAGLLIAMLVGVLGTRRQRAARIAAGVVIALFSLVVGLAGTISEVLWFGTAHVVTYGNENLLQANTLSLVLLGFLIAAWLKPGRGEKTALRVAIVIAGLSTLGFLLQVLPDLDQANGEIIGLFLPIHVAIAWVFMLRGPRLTTNGRV